MPTIMEILRHTQISQTRRYVKGRSHLSKDAMRRMGDAFLPAPEPVPEPATETGEPPRGPLPRPPSHPLTTKAQVRAHLTWASPEPPVGFEPTTYALQVRCSGQLS